MLYIIFTADGLTEAKTSIIRDQAVLWVNPELLLESDLVELKNAGIHIESLPEKVDACNEKAVLAAIAFVEKHSPHHEILVEYL
jgi:hypothetical protein